MNINGLNVETDKPGISMTGRVIVFGDGSTWNMHTGAFNNAGPGYVTVNGRRLVNNEGSSDAIGESATKTKSQDFPTTSLSLKLMFASVVVERHDRAGMHVELIGPANTIESIKLNDRAGTLSIVESSGGIRSGSIIIGNGTIMNSSFDGVSIGGVSFGGRHGEASYVNMGGSPVTMKVYVPLQTPIAVSTSSGNVEINNVDGPLNISIHGSADITASAASGNVQVDITGSGDVTIHDGFVDNLGINIAGSGDVRFGGTAQNAMMTIAGSGDISVEHVVNKPMKSVAGSGDIRVRRVG